MFKLMGKERNAILGAQTILIWTYVVYILFLQVWTIFHDAGQAWQLGQEGQLG